MNIVRPAPQIKVGPFLVNVLEMSDGWTRYALVIDKEEIEAWASMPGVNDCRDALLRHRKNGTPTLALVDLLIKSKAHAQRELQQLLKNVNGSSNKRRRNG